MRAALRIESSGIVNVALDQRAGSSKSHSLQQALKSQGRNYDAGFVQKEFDAAWKGGSVQLKVENLV